MALIQNSGNDPQGNQVPIPINGIVIAWNDPLGSGQSRQSEWIPTAGYSTIFRLLNSDQPSANGGLKVEFADQDMNIINELSLTSTYNPADGGVQALAFMIRGSFVRYTYTNGPAAQTKFNYNVWLIDGQVQTAAQLLSVPTVATTFSLITKSMLNAYEEGTNLYKALHMIDGALKVFIENQNEIPEGLAQNDTLISGAQRTVIVDGNNQARGTDASPFGVKVTNQITDYAKESGGVLASILAKLSGDSATETTLKALVAKLISNPATEATLSSILTKLNASVTVAGSVGINNFPTNQTVSGTVGVNNFPSDYSKESGNLLAILNKLTSGISVTGTFFQATQPVSLASQPLPTGGSTSALQTAGNSSLSNIDSDLGAPSDAQATNVTAAWSVIALLKGMLQRPGSGSTTSATTTASSSIVLPANANRKGATVFSVSGTILVTLGATTASNLFTARLVTNGYYEIPFGYTGPISAMGAGTLSITETT